MEQIGQAIGEAGRVSGRANLTTIASKLFSIAICAALSTQGSPTQCTDCRVTTCPSRSSASEKWRSLKRGKRRKHMVSNADARRAIVTRQHSDNHAGNSDTPSAATQMHALWSCKESKLLDFSTHSGGFVAASVMKSTLEAAKHPVVITRSASACWMAQNHFLPSAD